ncbi:GDSL esterase/lipase EXL3 [Beta vulgaris subsp. vulgaris]|uniref:GDSL esterase/lipase EXL3 n=1 Tax=Beta vulgaris subsp. vulgaris TaxID=3555 RepID=UPI0020372098|nr:GDSL esterase/lipase EXL3 [Beta vulgaris subsp. vulgaris]
MQYILPLSSLCASILSLSFYFFSIIFIITTTTVATLKLPPNVTVPAILGFGDSIIDPGNNNNIKTIIKCNFPPYGQDFMGGISTGRFSNGRIPTDFLAEEFSIKEYLPAYLDTNLSPQDLLTGVSFASGAAGFDPLTSQVASVISLSEQLEYFKEYTEKVKQLVGEEKTNFILTNSIYFIVAGSDDIANTYFGTPFRRLHYDVESYTDLMVESASSFVQELYKLGARRMGLFSAPPIGCVPSQRTIGGGIVRECAEHYNQAAQLYNSKLSIKLDSLAHKLPHTKVVYIDIYSPLLDLIQNPDKYGLEEVVKGCCGTGLLEVSVLCNKLDSVCPDDSKYLFWDSYHPTERGYQLLFDAIIKKYGNKLY